MTVDYATADGSAAAPGDYTAASGTLTFLPDETTQAVFVDVNGDTLDEDDETFTVELSNPANATIDDGEESARSPTTIPSRPSRSATAQSPRGTREPSRRPSRPRSTRQAAAPVTVDYATSDGTATAPGDYLAASGTVTFLPNQTSGR